MNDMIEAGHQPNYLPWLGFFDKMKKCDIFIIEDNVQFERQGFINRNKIKTDREALWLTVPISHKGNDQLINEVEIAGYADKWGHKHWSTIKHFYSRSPYWMDYYEFFEEIYNKKWQKLIDLNVSLIKGIMDFLDIDVNLVFGSSIPVKGKGTELIIAQCKGLGADTHLSGIGGMNYLDIKRFKEEGIKLIFQKFEYPSYAQLWGDFIPNLSVIDYLFCTGAKNF